MSRKQQRSGPVDADDVTNALRAFRLDMQCEARVVMSLDEENGLKIRVESYKEVNGVRIGIAHKDLYWEEGRSNVALGILQAIYFVYHYTEEHAYGQATTPEGRRITRKK